MGKNEALQWMDTSIVRCLGNALFSAAPPINEWPSVAQHADGTVTKMMPADSHSYALDVLVCSIITLLKAQRMPVERLIEELQKQATALNGPGKAPYNELFVQAMTYCGQLFVEENRLKHEGAKLAERPRSDNTKEN